MALSYTAFSVCVSDRWQLAIGDPNILGWAICAAYGLAAALAIIVFQTTPFVAEHCRREKMLWALIAVLMAGVALNKQLDLQTLLLTAGRCLSQQQGWYENRRLVQREFIFGLIAGVAIAALVLICFLRGIMRNNSLALLGLAALVGFVLIRGGHLLHIFVPERLASDILLHDLTSALEGLSPLMIIWSAWGLLRSPGPASAFRSR